VFTSVLFYTQTNDNVAKLNHDVKRCYNLHVSLRALKKQALTNLATVF